MFRLWRDGRFIIENIRMMDSNKRFYTTIEQYVESDHPEQLQDARIGHTTRNMERVASIFICKSAQAVNTNSKATRQDGKIGLTTDQSDEPIYLKCLHPLHTRIHSVREKLFSRSQVKRDVTSKTRKKNIHLIYLRVGYENIKIISNQN